MSVTIHWRPSTDKGKHFKTGVSRNLEVLKDAFGKEVGENDVHSLRVMAKASRDEFYDEVADIVEQVGSIEFWGEY